MADKKLSELTELAAAPADDDEVYIRDVSEVAAIESKRITIANLLAAYLALTGGTLTGDVTINKDTPQLILDDTDVDAVVWRIKSIVYAGASWVWIYNSADDAGLYIREDGQIECHHKAVIKATAEDPGSYPTLDLEATGDGKQSWSLVDDGTDLIIGTSGPGAISLAPSGRVRVKSALAIDHKCTGSSALMTAGINLVLPQAVYVGSDGKMEKVLATGAATMPAIALATGTINDNVVGEFLMQGFFRDDTWNWTPGGLLYASRDTAGALTQTPPATSGDQVQVVGIAITAKIIHWNPSYELVEVP